MSQLSRTYVLPAPAMPRRPFRFAVPLVVIASAAAYFYFSKPANDTNSIALTGTFFQVEPADMDVKIVNDGELMAINNVEVVNHVEGLNTITYVVPEGSIVKTGDVLVTLDSSTIKHKVDDLKATLDTAQAGKLRRRQ